MDDLTLALPALEVEVVPTLRMIEEEIAKVGGCVIHDAYILPNGLSFEEVERIVKMFRSHCMGYGATAFFNFQRVPRHG
jgi:hypothetical protein